MPKATSELKHTLGKTIALQRLKDSCEWARGFSDLKESWADSIMSFSTSIQGVRVSGTIEVTDDSLLLNANVPFIALPFKSWIPNILKNALKERRHVEPATGSDIVLLFYLHIPKAGGTTLGEFIYQQCKNDGDNDEGLVKNGVFFTADGFFRNEETQDVANCNPILNRSDLQAVIGHFAFGIHEGIQRPFRYITVLRHPVSRVVSLYHYLKLEQKMTLEDFVNGSAYREVDNDQTRRIAGVNPEVGSCTRQDLERAKENLRQHFAIVGTTERMDEMLALLKLQFGWNKPVASFPKNVNAEKKKDPLSAHTIAAIEKRNALDLELYQFANELMNEMIAAQGEKFVQMLKQQKELNSLHA